MQSYSLKKKDSIREGGRPRAVVVCFLDARSAAVQEHWLNQAAERLAPPTFNNQAPKIHCEILFPENDTTHERGYSCSIAYNGRVFFRRKSFSRQEWTFRVLRKIPAAMFDSMRAFCKSCVGDYFNHVGYMLYGASSGSIRLNGAWAGINYYPMGRRWFCSEIVIEALKMGNYLPADVSSVQHPETLYQLLKEQSAAGTAKTLSGIQIV